jgi:hypothetical protein
MQFKRLDPRRLLLAEAVAAALLLSACGGGGDDAAEPSQSETETTATADVAAPAASPVTDPQAAAPAADPTADPEAANDPAAVVSSTPDPLANDPAVVGEMAAPEPAAGETGLGSMEAVSQYYEDLEASGHPVEQASAEPDPQGDVPQETDPAQVAESDEQSDRESAQSLTNIAGRTHFAKPKVAALDYTSDVSSTKQALLAKYKLVVLGARGGKDLNAFTTGIKSRNPNTKLGYYVAFNELSCSATSGTYFYPLVQAANKTNYWLRYANGTRAQWTSAYNACDMNISGWGRKNSSGETWMKYKAKFDYNSVFSKAPKITFAFSDNTFGVPRVSADWKRIGTNQSKTLSEIIREQREGQAAYWSSLRSLKPGIQIIGNANNDLSFYEYKGKLNGAMQEAAMGKSWSLETWAGWDKMMARYRGQLRNSAAPKDVFLEVRASPTDYRTIRYGLASALLENGWFMHLPSSGAFKPNWVDEYEAPIGKPIESPPTAPKSNGIWMRKYENGVVLVNPSKTSTRSIYVGNAYKRLKGTQSPTVNNGAWQSTVTLGPRQGLIMIKR